MTSINLSSNAVKRIQGLLPSHKSNYFRVYVTGGGCSGFQYGFDPQAIEAMAFGWMARQRLYKNSLSVKKNKGLVGTLTQSRS